MNKQNSYEQTSCQRKDLLINCKIIQGVIIFTISVILTILIVISYKNTPQFIQSEHFVSNDYYRDFYSSQDFKIAVSFKNKSTNELINAKVFQNYNLLVFKIFQESLKYQFLDPCAPKYVSSTNQNASLSQCFVLPPNIQYFVNTSLLTSFFGLAFNFPNESPLPKFTNTQMFQQIYFQIYFAFISLNRLGKRQFQTFKLAQNVEINFITGGLITSLISFRLVVKTVFDSSFIVPSSKQYYELRWIGQIVKTEVSSVDIHLDAVGAVLKGNNEQILVYRYQKWIDQFIAAFLGMFFISIFLSRKFFSLCQKNQQFVISTQLSAASTHQFIEANSKQVSQITNDKRLQKIQLTENDIGGMLMRYKALKNINFEKKMYTRLQIQEGTNQSQINIFENYRLNRKKHVPIFYQQTLNKNQTFTTQFSKKFDIFAVRPILLKEHEKSTCQFIFIIILAILFIILTWHVVMRFQSKRQLQSLGDYQKSLSTTFFHSTNVKFAFCFLTTNINYFFGTNPNIIISLQTQSNGVKIQLPLQKTSAKDIEYIGQKNSNFINSCYKPVDETAFTLNDIKSPLFSVKISPNFFHLNAIDNFKLTLNSSKFFFLLPANTYNPQTNINSTLEKIELNINSFVWSLNNSIKEDIYVQKLLIQQQIRYGTQQKSNKLQYINYDPLILQQNLHESNETNYYSVNLFFDGTVKGFITQKYSILWLFGLIGAIILAFNFLLMPVLYFVQFLNQYQFLANFLFKKQQIEKIFFSKWKLIYLLPNCLYQSQETKKIKKMITFLKQFTNYNFLLTQINQCLYQFAMQNRLQSINYLKQNDSTQQFGQKKILSTNKVANSSVKTELQQKQEIPIDLYLESMKETSLHNIFSENLLSNEKKLNSFGKNKTGSCFGIIISLGLIILFILILSFQIKSHIGSYTLDFEEVIRQTNFAPRNLFLNLNDNFSIIIGFITKDNLTTQNISQYFGTVIEITLHKKTEKRDQVIQDLILNVSACDINSLNFQQNVQRKLKFANGNYYCFDKNIINLELFMGIGRKSSLEIAINFLNPSLFSSIKFQNTYILNLYFKVPQFNLFKKQQKYHIKKFSFPYLLKKFEVLHFSIRQIQGHNKIQNFDIKSYDLIKRQATSLSSTFDFSKLKIIFQFQQSVRIYNISQDNIILTIGIFFCLFYFIYYIFSTFVSNFNRYIQHYLIAKLLYQMEELSESQLLSQFICSFVNRIKNIFRRQKHQHSELERNINKVLEMMKLHKLSKNIFQLSMTVKKNVQSNYIQQPSIIQKSKNCSASSSAVFQFMQ